MARGNPTQEAVRKLTPLCGLLQRGSLELLEGGGHKKQRRADGGEREKEKEAGHVHSWRVQLAACPVLMEAIRRHLLWPLAS